MAVADNEDKDQEVKPRGSPLTEEEDDVDDNDDNTDSDLQNVHTNNKDQVDRSLEPNHDTRPSPSL